MSDRKKKAKAKAKAKVKPKPPQKAKKLAQTAGKPTASPKPAPPPAKPPAKLGKESPQTGGKPPQTGGKPPQTGGKPPQTGGKPAPAASTAKTPVAAKPGAHGPAKKSGKKTAFQRRGPTGELLLPGGPQIADEIYYLFRGCVAAEHGTRETATHEVFARRGPTEPEIDRTELSRQLDVLGQRFDTGHLDPMLPARPPQLRRNFASVQERARHRRREIGAFLRGLDIGHTDQSHIDSHGEASLESLMKWAAHLEVLSEAEEPDNVDYAQHHRFLDNLENSTESLIVDLEATLRRLRDRAL